MRDRYIRIVAIAISIIAYAMISCPVAANTIKLQHIMLKAKALEIAGNTDEAINTYSKMLVGNVDDLDTIVFAKQRIVQILLQRNPIDFIAVEKHFDGILPKDGNLTDEVWNVACSIMFAKVWSSEPKTRNETWAQEFYKLKNMGEAHSLLTSSIRELDKLIMGIKEGDSISSDHIINDLLEYVNDNASRNMLHKRLDEIKLRKNYYSNNSGDILGAGGVSCLMYEAYVCKEKGEIVKAIEIYKDVIDKYNESKEIVELAYVNILELYLYQDNVFDDDFEKHLQAIRDVNNGQMSNRIWNIACKILLKKILIAKPHERKKVWSDGINKLGSYRDDISISEDVIYDLDRMFETFEEDNSLSRLQVLTDLLLLIPDYKSMRLLQWRRINEYVLNEDWDNACIAAMLDVSLALTSEEGPYWAFRRFINITNSSGDTGNQQEYLEKTYLWDSQGTALLIPASQKTTNGLHFVDKYLGLYAKEILNNLTSDICPRRRAFVKLFAGNTSDAFQEFAVALEQTQIKDKPILKSFQDITVATAIVDSRYHRCNRFALWLKRHLDVDKEPGASEVPLYNLIENISDNQSIASARILNGNMQLPIFDLITEDNKAHYGQVVLDKWEQYLIGLGEKFLNEGNLQWAAAFWCAALETRPSQKHREDLIDDIYSKGQNSHYIVSALRIMALHLTSQSDKRQVLYKIAITQIKNGEFSDCIEELNNIDAIYGTVEPPDVDILIIRAKSLIRLNKYDEGFELLSRILSCSCNEYQYAEANFLVGWINLQRNKEQEAVYIFQRVVDIYPETFFAKKSQQLIQRLEGF